MSAPGLKRRLRADGTIAWYWVADAVSRQAKNYPMRTRRIVAETEAEAEAKAYEYSAELRKWIDDAAPTVSYSGTWGSLIDCYKNDEDSPYAAVRENTRKSYDHDLKILKNAVGVTAVFGTSRKDFARWHRKFIAPKVENGPRRVRRAHGLMTTVRGLLSFGVSMRFPGCKDAKEIIDEMAFELPEARHSAMTFAQARAIVEHALQSRDTRSIALGQALQYELGLRQIDVVGRWITGRSEAGITYRGRQWTGGITWPDLTADRLAKRTSKTGQEGQWNPAEYPLLVLAMAAFAEEERMGPAIVDERVGLPYKSGEYGKRWRLLATAAGVPNGVWNMDSRAGAITEADEAGADVEDVRKFATHANRQTTQRYVRRTAEATSRVAKLRVKHREGRSND